MFKSFEKTISESSWDNQKIKEKKLCKEKAVWIFTLTTARKYLQQTVQCHKNTQKWKKKANNHRW